jgi:hypothetical protein
MDISNGQITRYDRPRRAIRVLCPIGAARVADAMILGFTCAARFSIRTRSSYTRSFPESLRTLSSASSIYGSRNGSVISVHSCLLILLLQAYLVARQHRPSALAGRRARCPRQHCAVHRRSRGKRSRSAICCQLIPFDKRA